MWNVGPPWSSQKFRIRTDNTGRKRKLSGRRPSSSVWRSCSLLNYQGPEDQSLITGMPEEFTKERVVRIFKPAKSAMQSGTAGIKRYIHTFLPYLYIRGLYSKARQAHQLVGLLSSVLVIPLDPCLSPVSFFAPLVLALVWVWNAWTFSSILMWFIMLEFCQFCYFHVLIFQYWVNDLRQDFFDVFDIMSILITVTPIVNNYFLCIQ